LRIGYVDQEGQRTRRPIEPQYLYLIYPVWYAQAWDYLRKDIRNFRVDRIRYAHIEEDKFELRDEKSFTREIERVAAPV
jgi:predicted DNA-binding transcriptional regulator YafY